MTELGFPVPPNSEVVAVQALSSALDGVLVAQEMPREKPEKFVLVSRIGGGVGSLATSDPRFLIECYAQGRVTAGDFAEQVHHAWLHLRSHGVTKATSDNNLQPYESPDVNHVRFQFTGGLKIRLRS